MPTGFLVESSGVFSINGTDLARQGAPKPFEAAVNFIHNRGFVGGDFVTVGGSNGNVGNVPVIFITSISAAAHDEVIAAEAGVPPRRSGKAGKKRAAKKSAKKPAKKSSRKSAKKSANKRATKKSAKKSTKKSSTKSAKKR